MLSSIFSSFGLGVLIIRLGPSALRRLRAESRLIGVGAPDNSLVSIIIPARNEEANLPTLLKSLARLEHRNLEILVVDDASTDNTATVVQLASECDPRIRLLAAGDKPTGWVGKSWACEQGGKVAKGKWLLFTDADTEHFRNGLSLAIEQMANENLDLLSAVPNHLGGLKIDPLLGPFHLLVFLSSSAFGRQSRKRLFAIGQYLLFANEYYRRQGSHAVVKSSFAEDLDLAERCFQLGGRYGLNRTGEIFGVRMYASFSDFLAGWRRIFRQGFAHASALAVIEIFLVIACLMMSFRFAEASGYEIVLGLFGYAIIGLAQKKYGEFSWLGVLTVPFSVGLFAYISTLALYDRVTGRELRWRGRTYKVKP